MRIWRGGSGRIVILGAVSVVSPLQQDGTVDVYLAGGQRHTISKGEVPSFLAALDAASNPTPMSRHEMIVAIESVLQDEIPSDALDNASILRCAAAIATKLDAAAAQPDPAKLDAILARLEPLRGDMATVGGNMLLAIVRDLVIALKERS